MSLQGTFSIASWEEVPQLLLADDKKLNRAEITQTYSGDAQGQSRVDYQLFYSDAQTSVFNGFEQFEGKIAGVECRLVLCHQGRFADGVASSEFTVIAATGAEHLVGKTGYFKAPMGGQAQWQIKG